MTNSKPKVFVAMSGGVDSSVAAALLKDQGYEVEGVTMCFHIAQASTRRPSCCGTEGIKDARAAAKQLGIVHHVLDFSGEIEELVIEDFIMEYFNGRTPNPCVRCNQHIKFGALYRMAQEAGIDYLATGHYARIEKNDATGYYELKKGVDARKDQSYFLYGIPKPALSQVLFPLGGFDKAEVRQIARDYELPVSEKPESQDICFIPDSGYKEFLKSRLGEDVFLPGPFKDAKGNVVGEHQGIGFYTIGQRDKLGLALGEPVYVYKIDKATNTVYVGPRDCLLCEGLIAQQWNQVSGDIPKGNIEVMVRIRYNAPEVAGRLRFLDEDSVQIEFAEPEEAVTPGQSVVCYRDDVVIGGGIIEKATEKQAVSRFVG